jgi:uncharacterized coiled-coil protein SlyX
MAAIFQIRRGSGSVSLMDGELYLHKSSGSLQVGMGTTPITLARLDSVNSGSLYLAGNLTASNAYFSGDVAISGNLFLGNENTDTITATGEFTSDLIPNPTNTYSIGSNSKIWKNVYANAFSGSFSGSINGINEGISTFSASVDSRLDRLQESTASLNTFSSSQESKDIIIGAYTASMNTFSSSQETKNTTIASYTASMNTFTSSTNSRLGDIESYTSSLRTAIDVTGGDTRIKGNLIVDGTQTSLNTTETFIEDKSITLASGSTTSGIADGAGFNIAGANVSMSWEDTNQRLYFNTKVGILGEISSSTIVGLNGVSVTTYSTSVDSRLSNLQTTSASVNSSLTQINSFTSSTNGRLTNLESTSASVNNSVTSLNSSTASQQISIDALNVVSGSNLTRLTNLESATASLNTFTGSQNTKNSTLEIVTSSLNLATASFNIWTGSTYNTFSQSVDSRLDVLEYTVTTLDPGNVGASLLGLSTFTGSANSRLNNLEITSASVNNSITALNITSASLNSFSSSTLGRLTNIELTSASVNTSISNLNSYTSSLKGAITISGTDVSIAGNLSVLGTTTVIDTTTLAIKDNIIELNAGGGVNGGIVVRDVTGTTTSGSLLWDTTNDYWKAGPLGAESKLLRADGDGVISSSAQITSIFEEKASTTHTIVSGSSQITYANISSIPSGIVSGSTQVTPLLPTGVVSGSSQIASDISASLSIQHLNSKVTGIVSGSSQIDATLTANFNSGIKTKLNAETIISGSSQITYTSISSIPIGIVSGSSQTINHLNSSAVGVVSGSSQVIYLLPTGTVSGSSQVLGGTVIHSGSSGNYQFNSIGVGTAASAVAGEIRATNDITAYYSSDIRLKENIQPIQNALEKVESISGNTYDWKEGFEEIHSHKGNDIGVIAQEIEEILPQIVTNRDNGYKAVQYEKIVPLLIEAIKELSAKIKRLENK